ncbi:MAG: type I 3-dehydroquinate dehydratase [Chloroflexi bacterium]|nr:type I 3-dehydroquinate dehydratase [Chloroflexota bacterium]
MPMRMVAVAFGPATMAEACAGLPRIREVADCVELRLDLFDEPFDLAMLLRERGDLPVVATLRPPEQGGRCQLPAGERLKILVQAAELGAEYVDLEFDAASPAAQAAVRSAGARVIISRHDFSAMPPGLADSWWHDLAAQGADVVKVVGTAQEVRECLQVFRALDQADLPTIAIAMGEAGLATRVLALRAPQCLLTYAALDAGGGTAPGQLTVSDMRETYRAERLGSQTRVYGLLGPHAEGERLAEYNAWFAADGFDGVAVPFLARTEAGAIVEAFRELPASGWHVHGAELQQDVARVMDTLDGSARRQAKVNAVTRGADGGLTGSWVESPREQFAVWRAAT